MRSGNENQHAETEKGSKRWDRSHQRAGDSKVGEGLALLLFSLLYLLMRVSEPEGFIKPYLNHSL